MKRKIILHIDIKTPALLLAIVMLLETTAVQAGELPRMPEWLSQQLLTSQPQPEPEPEAQPEPESQREPEAKSRLEPKSRPEIYSEAAIVLEAETGTVLYEKRADKVVPPASLTKVMTIHLVLEAAREGSVSLDEQFEVPREAWARNMPPGSSLMFLGPGQHVSLRRLTEGLAIASGNDAAVAVALRLAGSVEEFVAMMNEEADRLGYEVMEYSDPAGLLATNQITAREYADFLRLHISRWPDTLSELYAKPGIVYPTRENFEHRMIGGSVRQYNRNPLLLEYPGVDGIKTGYIHAAGYNLAVSAERNGMRLIVVTLGAHANSAATGMRQRASDGSALLDYGFENFALARPERPRLEPLTVWKGAGNEVGAVPAEEVSALVVPRGREQEVEVSAELKESVVAPVEEGNRFGTLVYRIGDTVIKEVPIVAAAHVDQAGLLKRAWHTVVMFFESLFG